MTVSIWGTVILVKIITKKWQLTKIIRFQRFVFFYNFSIIQN